MEYSDEGLEYGAVDNLEINIQPYMFEPLPKNRREERSSNTDESSAREDKVEEDVNIQRIGHV